jgi:hypothetical protein
MRGTFSFEALAPLVVLAIRKAHVDELATEAAAVVAPLLTEPNDRTKAAALLRALADRLDPMQAGDVVRELRLVGTSTRS